MKILSNKREAEIDERLLKARFYKKYFERISSVLDYHEYDELVQGIIRFAWKHYCMDRENSITKIEISTCSNCSDDFFEVPSDKDLFYNSKHCPKCGSLKS